ncbi:hypothetical protein WN48_08496 [Eufriesea mexicana]|uniref:Uncharacterized protein n=1 Tax=Eufriesea mexicana TaxID=516756 RepID=A0A310S7R1_9HYME|nr:hypothetical protein WN48_08496 [Eufriesea mexicana]
MLRKGLRKFKTKKADHSNSLQNSSIKFYMKILCIPKTMIQPIERKKIKPRNL